MSEIPLSRLLITGDVDGVTPLVVLEEIALCHGLSMVGTREMNATAYYQQLLEDVRSTPVPVVSEPYSAQDLAFIARYVNPQVTWLAEHLMPAFEFLQHLTSDELYNPPANFSHGLQLPNDVKSHNACVLYKICLQNDISVDMDTTMEYMTCCIHLLINPTEVARSIFYDSLCRLPRDHLIRLYAEVSRIVLSENPTNADVEFRYIPSQLAAARPKFIEDLTPIHQVIPPQSTLPETSVSLAPPLLVSLQASTSMSVDPDSPIEILRRTLPRIPTPDPPSEQDLSGTDFSSDPELEELEELEEVELPPVFIQLETFSPASITVDEPSIDPEPLEPAPVTELDSDPMEDRQDDVGSVYVESMQAEIRTTTPPLELTIPGWWVTPTTNNDNSNPMFLQDIISPDGIDAVHSDLKDISSILGRMIPATFNEAVYQAAVIYGLDFSRAQCPIREYLRLRMMGRDWFPIDPYLASQVELNPLSIHLQIYFNPRLPRCLYTQIDLDRLALEEGFTAADLRQTSSYSLLQETFLESTFHHGKHITIGNLKTPISLKNVFKLDPNVVVCYGSLVDGVTAFCYGELAGAFIHARNFTNPLDNKLEVFPPRTIKKLKILTRQIRGQESAEALIEREGLFDAIRETELFTDVNNAKACELYKTYLSAEPDLQTQIRETLTTLLHLSMHMRGWLGEGSLPIEKTPVDDQEAVDIKIWEAIARFEKLCQELGPIGALIADLPLVRYKGEFQASTSTNEGLTVMDRITIVKTGNQSEGYNSCVRLSSNWLACSAYRYMDVIKMPVPFELDRLRDIS